MDKFNELLEKLKGLKLIQTSMDWADNIPEEIWKEYFCIDFTDMYNEVAYGLDVDQRRHYETSISVIEIYGKFLGIRHISNIYSESSSCEDCYVTIEFFEMKEVTITSYQEV